MRENAIKALALVQGSTPIAKRRGLQDALAQLEPESILLVYRLDRLARDLELQIRLFRTVTSTGARIVSTMDEGTNGNAVDDVTWRVASSCRRRWRHPCRQKS